VVTDAIASEAGSNEPRSYRSFRSTKEVANLGNGQEREVCVPQCGPRRRYLYRIF